MFLNRALWTTVFIFPPPPLKNIWTTIKKYFCWDFWSTIIDAWLYGIKTKIGWNLKKFSLVSVFIGVVKNDATIERAVLSAQKRETTADIIFLDWSTSYKHFWSFDRITRTLKCRSHVSYPSPVHPLLWCLWLPSHLAWRRWHFNNITRKGCQPLPPLPPSATRRKSPSSWLSQSADNKNNNVREKFLTPDCDVKVGVFEPYKNSESDMSSYASAKQ